MIFATGSTYSQGDIHQIMMMNDYMPTKVNDLYKALLSLG